MQIEQNKQFPRVTIMIPTYGQEDVILDAVDSALAQDYPNLEIIVADDASPDCTAELVASRQDPRLRYHRNSINVGRVANYRNTLYNLATGDWVVNLDGDDYYKNPRFITAAIQVAVTDPDIFIVSANCQIFINGDYLQPYPRPRRQIIPGIDIVSRVYDQRYHFFHMSTLYHRQKALLLDFYRVDTISTDWESLYRLALCGKVAFIDTVAGVWKLTGRNASLTLDWQSAAANLSIWDTIFASAAYKGNNYFQLFLSKQKILFSMAYLHLCTLIRSRVATVHIFKYLFAVRHYAGNITVLLLFLYYKSIVKIIYSFLQLIKR